MRQKGFSQILIILVVLTAIGGAYYFIAQKGKFSTATTYVSSPSASSTSAQTANWKIYVDPKGQYSFKYPSNWMKPDDMGYLEDPTRSFIFDVQTIAAKLDIQAYIDSKCIVLNTNFCSNPVPGPIINSLQYNHPKSNYDSIDTVTLQQGKLFVISLSSRNPKQSADEDTKLIYNQILSTFKFTQ